MEISQIHKDIPFGQFISFLFSRRSLFNLHSSSHSLPFFRCHKNPHSSFFSHFVSAIFPLSPIVTGSTLFKRKGKMSEFSLSNSGKTNKIPSCLLLSRLFSMFIFFIFLSPYILMLLCSFSPLLFTTLFLLVLFPPKNLDHHGSNDDYSRVSDSKLGFLLSVVESIVRKLSSKNDGGNGCFDEEFLAYLDVFRATEFEEVLEGNFSDSGFSGDEGRESKAHVGPMEKNPNGNFDQNPFGKDGDSSKVEAARPIAVLEENFSESGYSGNDGRESRNHVGPREKEPSVHVDENLYEKDKGKVEAARPIAEENKFGEKECNEVLKENFSESFCSEEEGGRRSHVDLIEDPTVSLEEKPAGEDDDVDKVEKNTKLNDMFCQKRDKEVKPLDTDPNKADEKMSLRVRSGSKVMRKDGKIDAKDSTTTANSEQEEEEEEYFETPERYWDFSNRSSSYGSMRKEKEWRRTLAFKLYEERNSVDDYDGSRSGSEAMDSLWETYEDIEYDKVKGSTKSEANDENEDEEEGEEEEEEKEKGIESKYCCLQALKLSAGKMNLGMRKPSLMKISKALKSIGFLHHHVSKHGRKKIH